jgi:hypothetical protein
MVELGVCVLTIFFFFFIAANSSSSMGDVTMRDRDQVDDDDENRRLSTLSTVSSFAGDKVSGISNTGTVEMDITGDTGMSYSSSSSSSPFLLLTLYF